mmetsp:Transcript_67449/g.152559  ORF Transcript_67449/g.152559 Transcript_67449/m.152559 type:complete len:232 (-) Transcript_67449:65-760(-)
MATHVSKHAYSTSVLSAQCALQVVRSHAQVVLAVGELTLLLGVWAAALLPQPAKGCLREIWCGGHLLLAVSKVAAVPAQAAPAEEAAPLGLLELSPEQIPPGVLNVPLLLLRQGRGRLRSGLPVPLHSCSQQVCVLRCRPCLCPWSRASGRLRWHSSCLQRMSPHAPGCLRWHASRLQRMSPHEPHHGLLRQMPAQRSVQEGPHHGVFRLAVIGELTQHVASPDIAERCTC